MHVAIDADKMNIVSLSITDERSHDDLTPKDLGNAEKTEERKIGDDRLTFTQN